LLFLIFFCCEEAKKEICGKNRITGKYDLPFVFLYSGIARSLSTLSPVVESRDEAGADLEHQVSNFSVVWGLLVFTIASYVPLFRYNRNPANCQYPGRPQHYSHKIYLKQKYTYTLKHLKLLHLWLIFLRHVHHFCNNYNHR